MNTFPQVGTEQHGFRTVSVEKYPFKDAHLVTMEHTKSGATLLYIACDDTDRAFNLAFRTLAHDNKGLPHIFEHSSLAGSKKYPSSNLVFEMMNRTYTTYLNAMTAQCVTMYPSSSLSEEQLLVNLDVYMSGVMDPVLLSDERGMKREAYRYVLEDPDGPMYPTGAVYNEMKGNYAKITYASMKQTFAALLPDSVLSYVTGGVPEDVLTVEWQDLKDFHAKYYHPSNMLILLYGNLHIDRFLAFLDENYLSAYSKAEICLSDDSYKPFSGMREATFLHPVSLESKPENGSVLTYAIALNGISLYDRTLLDIVNTAFNMDSFGMKKAFTEKLPGTVFEANIYDLPTPIFFFTLANANPEDKELFMEIIRTSLDDLVKNGLDADIVQIAVNSIRMKTYLDAEESGGVNLTCDFGHTWSFTGQASSYLETCKALLELEDRAGDRSFDRLVREYLVEPGQSVLTVTKPDPGAEERNKVSFEAEMERRKNALSREELLALVRENEDFEKWSQENQAVSLIERVNAVSVQDLPEETKIAVLKEEQACGMPFMLSPIPDAPYIDVTIRFDASGIPVEYLRDYALYTLLLGYLDTDSLSAEALEKQLNIYAHDYVFHWENTKYRSGGNTPYFKVNFFFLSEFRETVTGLLEDVLLHTRLDDYSKIRNFAARELNEDKMSSVLSPHIMLFNLTRSMGNPDCAYDGYLSLFDFWKYLEQVAAMSDEEMRALTDRMKQIRDFLLKRERMSVSVIGSEESITWMQSRMDSLASRFPKELPDLPAGDETIPSFPESMAVVLDGDVQYNGHYLYWGLNGVPFSAKLQALFTLVRSNYLLPEIRFRHGAYSIFCSAGEKECYTFSYRDPEMDLTYETFSKISEWLRTTNFSQSDLDGPVVSCFSALAKPLSPLALAREAILKSLCKMYDPDFILRSMRELKSFSLQDIKDLAYVFDMLCEKGVTASAGSLSAIEKNKDRFEVVLTDLVR